MEQKYIINPRYNLRNEMNKVVLLMKPDFSEPSSIYIIHPIYAIILSFVDGRSVEEAAKEAAKYLKVEKKEIVKILNPLIENDNPIQGFETVFPEFFLVKYSESLEKRGYQPSDFNCNSLDLKLSRLMYPADIICNLTMKCHTSCLYCYADRSHHQHHRMSPKKISEIIDEAYRLGVVSFKLMGGDIFTYNGWDIILRKLNSYSYSPCISTKIPLKEADVQTLKELIVDGIPIQISLDSFISDHIAKILRIDGSRYLKEMVLFVELLEKYEIDYTIHSVLCNINDNIFDMQAIEHFIKDKKHIKEWYIDSAKCSMYLPYGYSSYKPNKEKVLAIANYVKQVSHSYPALKIHAPTIVRSHNKIDKNIKRKVFDRRISCSGNLSSMYILPDGKVTLCEELYWHPTFVLGDLNKNSIEEIWNSKKAIDLFFLKQSKLSPKSACTTCSEFAECRSYKHVCWRDVVLAYGDENWDFPDPFCPNAPTIINDISME